jgi:hypothetical protein
MSEGRELVSCPRNLRQWDFAVSRTYSKWLGESPLIWLVASLEAAEEDDFDWSRLGDVMLTMVSRVSRIS